jgi:hypothetical protein
MKRMVDGKWVDEGESHSGKGTSDFHKQHSQVETVILDHFKSHAARVKNKKRLTRIRIYKKKTGYIWDGKPWDK